MKNMTEQRFPEARSEDLVVQHLADEVLVYDNRRHKAHCLNRTAALVWKHCDGRTSAAAIAAMLQDETNQAVSEDVVWLALDQLGKSNLLVGHGGLPQAGISRRELIRRIGIAAAVAAPVVTSIVAPKAAQAATCIPSGGTGCTAGPQCCSGLCNAGTCA